MYRHTLDEVDAPLRPRRPSDYTKELDGPRKPKKPDIFQNELKNKLKDRKKLGLTADLTSEESGVDDDMENLDNRTQFGVNRPASAKRRPDRSPEWKPNHGDTLRPSDSGFSNRYQSIFDDEDQEVASLGGTMGFPKVERSGVHLPGTKKPSPRDQFDSGLHGRKTPTGKHTPVNESPRLSKEDLIFGTKTQSEEQKSKGSFFKRKSTAAKAEMMSNGDSNESRQWQPPSFRKSPTEQREQHSRTPSPAGSRGRKTPSSLDPISESATPRDVRGDVHGEKPMRPRLRRQGSTSSDKQSPRTLSVESSPRSEKPTPRPRHEKETPKGRTTPTVDIFGKPRRLMDDEEPEVKPKPKLRGSSEMSKTAPSGRKTPTEKKTVSGRKTPTLSKTQGRLTPTGRKSPSDEGVKPREEKPQKQTSLLGYLTGEADATEEMSSKRKTREQSRDGLRGRSSPDGLTRDKSRDGLSREQSKDRLKKERSRDDLKREKSKDDMRRERSKERLTRQRSHDSQSDSGALMLLQQPQKPSADDSSVCEEFAHDPQSKVKKTQADSRTNRVQRSDRQQAEDAICGVADAQMTFIEPDKKQKQKSATKDPKVSKHRPQPRYPTLPGQATPETPRTFEDTVSIREAIFAEWYYQRTKEVKKKVLEQKKKEKEEEDKKLKEKEEKLQNGVAAFTAWSKDKDKTLGEKARKKREEEQKKEEAKREEQVTKEKDMLKTFNTWKERKDDLIKETVKKNARLKHELEEDEHYKKKEKEKKGYTAFTSWKSRKDDLLIKKAKEEKQKEKQTIRHEKTSKELKEEEAMKKYEDWLVEKEKREREEKYRRRMSERELQERPAWSPANRTVPFGR